MQDEWRFLEIFGKIDDELILKAGEPWKKRYWFSGIQIAGILLIIALCLSCIFHSEVKAGLERVRSYLEEFLGIEEDISAYKEVIDYTVQKENCRVTLKEAVMESSELIIVYYIEPIENQEEYITFRSYACINGKRMGASDSYSFGADTPQKNYYQVECYRFGKLEGKQAEIQLQINSSGEMDVEGEDYDYEFLISCEEIMSDTIQFPMNQNLQVKQAKFALKEFTLNGIESTITARVEGKEEGTDYYLKGEDSLGNSVKYRAETYEGNQVTFVLDKTEGYLSPKAQWVELQFYIHEGTYEVLEENGGESDLYDTTDADVMKPVGESFVVRIKGQ